MSGHFSRGEVPGLAYLLACGDQVHVEDGVIGLDGPVDDLLPELAALDA
jgi:hypothetical protein